MRERLQGLLRWESLPPGLVAVFFCVNLVREVVALLGDIEFVATNVHRLSWAVDLIFHPVFNGVGLLLVIAYLLFGPGARPQGITVLQDGRPIPKTWHERIEADDRRHLPARVMLLEKRRDLKHLDAPQPYLDLTFALLNCSIFTVTFEDRVDGRLSCHGQELKDTPQIIAPASGVSIPHGQKGQITLRQWLPRDVADAIGEQRPQEFHVPLTSSEVILWIRAADDPSPNADPSRLALPGEVFEDL